MWSLWRILNIGVIQFDLDFSRIILTTVLRKDGMMIWKQGDELEDSCNNSAERRGWLLTWVEPVLDRPNPKVCGAQGKSLNGNTNMLNTIGSTFLSYKYAFILRNFLSITICFYITKSRENTKYDCIYYCTCLDIWCTDNTYMINNIKHIIYTLLCICSIIFSRFYFSESILVIIMIFT